VYTYYTKEKDKKSVVQNSGIRIEAIDPQGLKTTYYGYIQDILELSLRIRIPVFMCQWVKHPNGINIDNYKLTLVDLKNVGHQDDPWMLADRITHVFYVLDPETGKHVVVSGKQKIVGVENVEDNDENVNHYSPIQ
jgi:hypothetical protein